MFDLCTKRGISNSKKKLERIENNSSVLGVIGNLSSTRDMNIDSRLSDVKEHMEAKTWVKDSYHSKQNELRLSFTKLSKDFNKENLTQNPFHYNPNLFSKNNHKKDSYSDKSNQGKCSEASKISGTNKAWISNTSKFTTNFDMK